MWDLLVTACGLLSRGMVTLSCGMHAGSSSRTGAQTWALCIGSVESYPLDHQGTPEADIFHEHLLHLLTLVLCVLTRK